MTGRRIVIVAAVLTILGVVGLAVAGQRGELDGPDGTLAFQRLVNGMGGQVTESDRPTDGATFLLMQDLRGPEEVDAILGWVEAGGRLVVADPTSAIGSSLGVAPAGFASSNLLGVAALAPSCVVPEVVDVAEIQVRAVELGLTPGPADRVGCFPAADGSYLVAVPHGAGRVLVLGGGSVLWNEFLDDGDNAAFAIRLAGGPGTDVVMGSALPYDREPTGTWETLPSPARTVVLGLVLASLVFILARWRRLGYPREEPAPSPIPASALVTATGALLRSSADRSFAAEQLRGHHADRIRRRLGIGPDLPPRDVGRAVDDRRGDGDTAERLLSGPPPRTDEQLLRLARDLERLTRQMEETP